MVDRGGIGRELRSRTEDNPALRGTKHRVATEREVRILLSNGRTVEGLVRVYRPTGRDRLSDYARAPEAFRYVETAGATLIVNTEHIVELRETTQA